MIYKILFLFSTISFSYKIRNRYNNVNLIYIINDFLINDLINNVY